MKLQSPPLQLLQPVTLGERFFPKGSPCGFYPTAEGKLHPNVTSILGHSHPFDPKKWAQYEPEGFDCEAAGAQAAATGTAVHCVMERFLLGQPIDDYDQRLAVWVEPLLASIGRASAVIGVELPLAHSWAGMRYAGSCDAVLQAPDGELVVVDFKTRRDTSYKKDEPNKPNLKYLTKQKTQVACYASTINAIYADQLPQPISRATLLFAVPGLDAPIPVTIAGEELDVYVSEWRKCLQRFYDAHQESVEKAQASFEFKRRTAA